jgi:hypothetical protein
LRHTAVSPFIFKIRAYIFIKQRVDRRRTKEGTMPTNGRNQARIGPAGVILVIAASVLAMLSGCSTQNYGRFALDARVSRDFREGAVQPQYQYYYAGRDTMPYAVIGIDAGYTIPSRYWIPFKPQPGQLKKMSANIYGEVDYSPYGAHILDPDGNIIGVWYSNVVIRSKTVQVLFKNPENTDDQDDVNDISP